MTGKQDSHVERHKHKVRKMDAIDVAVQFSPEVEKNFVRLEAIVHDSPHFDSDLLLNLQNFASGNPPSLIEIVPGMAQLAGETMRYVSATGDARAADALADLRCSMLEPNALTALITTPSQGVDRK